MSAIGHQRIFRLTGWSRQIHTRFHGPRATREKTQTVPAVSSTGVAPSMPGPSRPFDYHQHFLLPLGLVDPRNVHPTTPNTQPLPGITRARFSLIRFRSPLLTESLLFSLPVGTEMFHFPTFPPNTLCVQVQVTRHDSGRVSPFGNPRITACLSTPRGISQITTSFIGSWCQGIHRVPLKT